MAESVMFDASGPDAFGQASPDFAATADSGAQAARWLVEAFSSQLAAVFEAMAGVRPAVKSETSAAGQVHEVFSSGGVLLWKQVFSSAGSAVLGALWLGAAEADWTAAGTSILRAAGIGPEDTDAPSVRSSYLETIGQAVGGLAQALSARLGREVTPAGGAESGERAALEASETGIVWSSVRCDLADAAAPLVIHVGCERALLHALESASPQAESSLRKLGQRVPDAETEILGSEISSSAAGRAKTFNLLLDVELPVSVSFGGAEVSLKEVLKLTTGSIVELNRTISEPVDIVVNNCIIARGEVVVIEGNFGVRVREVISRQERMRTLR